MKPTSEKIHEWNVLPKEAVALQEALRKKVLLTPLKDGIKTIAGVDVSMNLYEKDVYAGVVVLSYPELTPLYYSVVKSTTSFPYIPGLLSFREIPALIECFKGLSVLPDVVIVDGQGITHPRHLGIASHLGVLLNLPTIGCAKSRLYGSYKEPKEVNEQQLIKDPKTKEILGTAIKTKKNSNPILVSPGHLVSVDDAVRIVTSCIKGYRLPETTRLAHELVNKLRRGEIK